MKYFGEPYPSRECPAPVFEDGEEIATPVGMTCLHCEEPIEKGDTGFLMPTIMADGMPGIEYVHFECNVRSIVGSVKHQRGECGCVTGDFSADDDAEYPTRRAAAKAALKELTRRSLDSGGGR